MILHKVSSNKPISKSYSRETLAIGGKERPLRDGKQRCEEPEETGGPVVARGGIGETTGGRGGDVWVVEEIRYEGDEEATLGGLGKVGCGVGETKIAGEEEMGMDMEVGLEGVEDVIGMDGGKVLRVARREGVSFTTRGRLCRGELERGIEG